MPTDGDSYLTAEVYQASGVLAEEQGCSPDDALARMASLALSLGCTLADVASEILDRLSDG
jgi:AmiR/NasT family two-component response regulator